MTPLILAYGAGAITGLSVACMFALGAVREARRKSESASKRYLQLVRHYRARK